MSFLVHLALHRTSLAFSTGPASPRTPTTWTSATARQTRDANHTHDHTHDHEPCRAISVVVHASKLAVHKRTGTGQGSPRWAHRATGCMLHGTAWPSAMPGSCVEVVVCFCAGRCARRRRRVRHSARRCRARCECRPCALPDPRGLHALARAFLTRKLQLPRSDCASK